MVLTWVLTLVAIVALPFVLEAAVKLARRAGRRWVERRDRRRAAYDPLGPPIERISADLHRLTITMSEIERSNPPMKAARLQATWLAYDDVLLTACRALEVDVASRPPLMPVQRLQAEAELARHGLSW